VVELGQKLELMQRQRDEAVMGFNNLNEKYTSTIDEIDKICKDNKVLEETKSKLLVDIQTLEKKLAILENEQTESVRQIETFSLKESNLIDKVKILEQSNTTLESRLNDEIHEKNEKEHKLRLLENKMVELSRSIDCERIQAQLECKERIISSERTKITQLVKVKYISHSNNLNQEEYREKVSALKVSLKKFIMLLKKSNKKIRLETQQRNRKLRKALNHLINKDNEITNEVIARKSLIEDEGFEKLFKNVEKFANALEVIENNLDCSGDSSFSDFIPEESKEYIIKDNKKRDSPCPLGQFQSLDELYKLRDNIIEIKKVVFE
ncbi:hypothetical protein ROZALSC1DRAFT_27571, partial [Rozella allomycis CSF55]